MSSRTATRSESRYDRWWWRVWYAYFVAALVWLGVCGWLMRPAPEWTTGWLAWWSGDRQGNHPSLAIANKPDKANQIVNDQKNPAYITAEGSSIHLGRLPAGTEAWTWTGWLHATTPLKARRANSPESDFRPWDPNFVVFMWMSALTDRAELGVVRGKLSLFTTLQDRLDAPTEWRTYAYSSPASPPVDQWCHIGVARDDDWIKIWINGTNVLSRRTHLPNLTALGSVVLRADFHRPPNDPTIRPGASYSFLQDDLVLFGRILRDDEVASLHQLGRGGWVQELDRQGLGGRIWSAGWPAMLITGALLLAFKLAPRLSAHLGLLVSFGLQPHFRPVRWIVVAGGLASAIATVAMTLAARRADDLRFSQAVRDFETATDHDWERIAGLCVRAKDWVAGQTNLTQDAWETWLTGNRYPHDYPGLIGIGYAEQVLPQQLEAHERTWRQRHGFPYRVTPGAEDPRLPVRELEGNPLLPVVVYRSADAKRLTWFTNHTFLGRDLLHQSVKDARPWAAARRVEESAARNEIQTSSVEVVGPAKVYGNPIQGLQIYAPDTRRNKKDDPALVLESAAWRGLAFADVDFERMLLERLGNLPSPVGFRIFTGTWFGERHDLVADSSTFLPATGKQVEGRLRKTAEIRFYYRRLHIDFWTTPAFEEGSLRKWAWFFGAGGLGMTGLAAALVIVQIRARQTQGRVLDALEVANNKLLLAYHERERISRDLHDGSIQNLYALGLHLQRVQALFGAQSNRAQAGLNESLSMLDHSITDLRQFILSTEVTESREPTVSAPADALLALVEQQRRMTDAEIVLRLHEDARHLDSRAGAHLVRMAREGISNALRHGKARRIEVQLERQPTGPDQRSRWVFELRDDGSGFDPARVSGEGRGLRNLRSRAADLGGEFVIESVPNEGTTVRVTFAGDAPGKS